MQSELSTTLSGRNIYKIMSLAAGLRKSIWRSKFNKWPFNHSFDSLHFIISVFISPVAKKLNGCPVAPFEHAHFSSRARGFFILCQFSIILYTSEINIVDVLNIWT